MTFFGTVLVLFCGMPLLFRLFVVCLSTGPEAWFVGVGLFAFVAFGWTANVILAEGIAVA